MLTPLQEIASRIYAAKIASGVLTNTITVHGLDTSNKEFVYNSNLLINECITEAKTLLEACKAEPMQLLQWSELIKVKGYTHPAYYSEGYVFEIALSNDKLKFILSLVDTDKEVGNFETLEEAKAFAEHIRTR